MKGFENVISDCLSVLFRKKKFFLATFAAKLKFFLQKNFFLAIFFECIFNKKTKKNFSFFLSVVNFINFWCLKEDIVCKAVLY